MITTQWRENRLKNYAEKLRISKRKALDRLMLFKDVEKLRLEFDRICDSQFWSSNEPGLSHMERKHREKRIYAMPTQGPKQLNLFYN